jgi:hypothetical protein
VAIVRFALGFPHTFYVLAALILFLGIAAIRSMPTVFAAVFVYLLMVVNYQTFGDPFVVILALPVTLCGIVAMLFITGTTLNVPPRTRFCW